MHVLARQSKTVWPRWSGSLANSVRAVGADPEEGPKPASPAAVSGGGFWHDLAALLPENAVVVEDAVTSGRAIFPPTFTLLRMTGFKSLGSDRHAFRRYRAAVAAGPQGRVSAGRRAVCIAPGTVDAAA